MTLGRGHLGQSFSCLTSAAGMPWRWGTAARALSSSFDSVGAGQLPAVAVVGEALVGSVGTLRQLVAIRAGKLAAVAVVGEALVLAAGGLLGRGCAVRSGKN